MNLTIAKKLWLNVISTAIGIAVLMAILLISERRLIQEEREISVRQAVELADGVLRHYYELQSKGILSEDVAKSSAKEEIKKLRYGGNNYFSIYNLHSYIVMHPFDASLEGKDQSGLKDSDGKLIVQSIVNAAKAGNGEFTPYLWPKPGSADSVAKTAYGKLFAPWGWIISSGVYLDTVQTTFIRRAAASLMEALALLAILAVICFLILRSIARSLKTAIGIAETVAAGDLTSNIAVQNKDEIGQLLSALNDMNKDLLRIVGKVRGGTDAIAAASGQIASGNIDLATRTEQQAASLDEITSLMQQLTLTVKENADNSGQANQLAVSASEVAVKGGDVVAPVIVTMNSINESAKKIVDIIGVIDGIAFQTNILALNAAVEAARAGEQGRGFAVVASEVRNLAQRSAAAAREIKTLISDSVEKIDTTSKQVDQAGATMNEIVSSVKRVTDIMGQITSASHDQSVGIERVNQAIIEMDNVTQHNTSLVEVAAAAAGSLHDQAANLAQVVSVFKLGPVNNHAIQM